MIIPVMPGPASLLLERCLTGTGARRPPISRPELPLENESIPACALGGRHNS
jgi:hypothetical protein